MKPKIHANIDRFIEASDAEKISFPAGCFYQGRIFKLLAVSLYDRGRHSYLIVVLNDSEGYEISLSFKQNANQIKHIPLAEKRFH